jgi:hypothetical protein
MDYAVWMGSGAIIYIPSSIKTNSAIQKLYRAIVLILDSIHHLVCGRQKTTTWLRLALSNGPNWVRLSCPIHVRTETDPVSETLWSFVFHIPDDG